MHFSIERAAFCVCADLHDRNLGLAITNKSVIKMTKNTTNRARNGISLGNEVLEKAGKTHASAALLEAGKTSEPFVTGCTYCAQTQGGAERGGGRS